MTKFNEINWPETVTELHVHLGGSVPLYRLWEIAVERGIRGLGGGYEEFLDILKIEDDRVRDLDTYLEVYDTIELIQSGPQSVRESIFIASQRAYRTGGMAELGPGGEGGTPNSAFKIGKLELRFNPLKRTGAVFLKGQHAGLYDVDRVIKAACEVVEDIEIGFRGALQVGLIFCFGRDMTFEANKVLAEKTLKWLERSDRIIGIDVAGHESRNSFSDPRRLEEMKVLYEMLDGKLGKTVHSGETEHVDLPTFIKTIEALNPERVAHPIVILREYWRNKDDRGLKLLKERGIIVELCPRSNILTRAVNNLEDYGKLLATLDKYEIPYTFSTDAPSLQVSSLAKELKMLLDSGAANADQILRALDNAEKASFLNKLKH